MHPKPLQTDASPLPHEQRYRLVVENLREVVFQIDAEGRWTFLSPAMEIGPGERTGHYRTTGEQLLFDAQGRSFISFEDYAVAVLDELERPQHVGERFGVAY